MEAVIRRLVREPPDVSRFALDFSRVTDVDPPSAQILLELYQSLGASGRVVAFAGMARHPRLVRLLDEARAEDESRPPAIFDELERAVERAAFDSFDVACPALEIRLLGNLLRSATKTWSRLSLEAGRG